MLKPDLALSASVFEGAVDPAVPFIAGRACQVPTAVIFYDAIPWRFPKQYLSDRGNYSYYKRRIDSLEYFDSVLCISDFSRNEAESVLKRPDAVNMGAGIADSLLTAIKTYDPKAPEAEDKYFLYVGGLDWRKNVKLIFGARELLAERGLNAKVLVVGDNDDDAIARTKAELSSRANNHRDVVFLNHVSDAQLVNLYKNALALIQPSFMEGFGLTALEAMACGTPAIVARAGALPEVVGECGLLFDPSSPEELSRLMHRVIEGDIDHEALHTEGKRAVEQFTWKNAAEIFVGAAREVVSNRKGSSETRSNGEVSLQARKILASNQLEVPQVARLFALSEPAGAESTPRLFVDASSTMIQDHKTGIQRVVSKICGNICELDGDTETRILFCDDETGWYSSPKWTGKPLEKSINSRIVERAGDHFLMLDSSWAFHTLHQSLFCASRLRGAEIISCLYDTVPLRSPAFCDLGMPIIFSQWFRTALTYSTGFVCISRAVADELYAILDAISFPQRLKIGYWQLGADFVSQAPESSAEELQQRRPIKLRPVFLMVGTLEPRKGHRVALDAFESLWLAGVDVDLVIVGKKGWGIRAFEQRIRHHPEFGRRLVWHHGIDDATLRGLYESCDALLAASFAEGFGLPIVEAGYFSKPVIASDIPVFREVAKGAASARFFKAGSSRDLADTVRNFLASKRTEEQDGASCLLWPSWRESAEQLHEVALGKNWYKIYEPHVSREYAALGDLGQISMDKPLSVAERTHSLRLVEGPDPDDSGRAFKIVVAVTNESSTVWSSEGAPDGNLSVALSFHVLNGSEKILQFENQRSFIPFVHLPGDVHYMAVFVPAEWKLRGARYVDIELVQEGVAWFGKPLRVAL